MKVQTDTSCTVHYITQEFTAINEIGQLHKGLRSKNCNLRPFFFTFARARVHTV